MTMIGKEENQEEVSFKVADRRKFNPDGSLKEGVTFDEPERATTELEQPEPVQQVQQDVETEHAAEAPPDEHADGDIPGAADPASFVNFLSTLATNAAAALGAVPHPATGKRSLDLETGKYWLDVLGMIKEKTTNNLHPKEQHLLDGLLGDLRMQYVHIVKATEEKLKTQAAAKFSGDELLGKKQ
ncbi:MAG: DUF1844 domain-containing protein [Chloracidobacterium sp.]|nr:DUF1844 domain-containing protein [Chloracidobacterium sp.]